MITNGAEPQPCLRRLKWKTDHVDRFRRELGVTAFVPGLTGSQIDVVLAQEAPNVLNVSILQQHRTRPAGIAFGRLPIQKRQNALVRRLTIRLASWSPADDRSVRQAHSRQSGAAIC
jgi:hypothetical protein